MNTAILAALAVSGPLLIDELAAIGQLTPGSAYNTLCRWVRRGVAVRTAPNCYGLGPEAPAWARLLATYEAERAGWQAEKARLLATIERAYAAEWAERDPGLRVAPL